MLKAETYVVAPQFAPKSRQAFMPSMVFLINKPRMLHRSAMRRIRVSKQGVNERRYSDDSFPCVDYHTGQHR